MFYVLTSRFRFKIFSSCSVQASAYSNSLLLINKINWSNGYYYSFLLIFWFWFARRSIRISLMLLLRVPSLLLLLPLLLGKPLWLDLQQQVLLGKPFRLYLLQQVPLLDQNLWPLHLHRRMLKLARWAIWMMWSQNQNLWLLHPRHMLMVARWKNKMMSMSRLGLYFFKLCLAF